MNKVKQLLSKIIFIIVIKNFLKILMYMIFIGLIIVLLYLALSKQIFLINHEPHRDYVFSKGIYYNCAFSNPPKAVYVFVPDILDGQLQNAFLYDFTQKIVTVQIHFNTTGIVFNSQKGNESSSLSIDYAKKMCVYKILNNNKILLNQEGTLNIFSK